MSFVLIVGEVCNGHRFIGPFASVDDLAAYVVWHEATLLDDTLGQRWAAVTLVPPEPPARAIARDADPLIILAGDMVNGFLFIGPFADTHGVEAYADAHEDELDDKWISAPLEPPEVPEVPEVASDRRSGSTTVLHLRTR
jgi:hypothetical protein